MVTSWSQIYDPDAKPVDVVYTVTVPVGTNTCYFIGAPSRWVQMPMSRVDKTHLTIIINTSISNCYKYCSGPDWAYEELDANGQATTNRDYNPSDVVARWRKVYYSSPVGVTYNVTVPSGIKACFLTGEMNNWGLYHQDPNRFISFHGKYSHCFHRTEIQIQLRTRPEFRRNGCLRKWNNQENLLSERGGSTLASHLYSGFLHYLNFRFYSTKLRVRYCTAHPLEQQQCSEC